MKNFRKIFLLSLGHFVFGSSGKFTSDSQRVYGTGYGDPHFMVHTAGQEPICFDFNPKSSNEIVLLVDPVANLVVTARTTDRDHKTQNRTFMTQIFINSPNAVKMEISAERGIRLTGRNSEIIPERNPKTGFFKYGDVTYSEMWTKNKTIDHITIQLDNGPGFIVKSKKIRKVLSFGVLDVYGLSEKTHGVIGSFVRPNAYGIVHRTGSGSATILANGKSFKAVKENYHHTVDCWNVQEEDILSIIS